MLLRTAVSSDNIQCRVNKAILRPIRRKHIVLNMKAILSVWRLINLTHDLQLSLERVLTRQRPMIISTNTVAIILFTSCKKRSMRHSINGWRRNLRSALCGFQVVAQFFYSAQYFPQNLTPTLNIGGIANLWQYLNLCPHLER